MAIQTSSEAYSLPNTRSTMQGKMPSNEIFRESAALAKNAQPSSDLPLIVISHDPDLRNESLPVMSIELPMRHGGRCKRNSAIFQLAKHGSSRRGGGHYIQNDWPDVVIQAVHEMVEQRAPVSRSPHSRSTRH